MWARLSGLTAACLLLCGCSPAPSKSDLVGVWTRKHAGTVIFSADGRFVARDVPAANLLGDFGDVDHLARMDASGAWRLTAPPGKREFGLFSWDVELQFDPLPVYAPGGAVRKANYIGGILSLDGDEDKSTIYEKRPRGAHLRAE